MSILEFYTPRCIFEKLIVFLWLRTSIIAKILCEVHMYVWLELLLKVFNTSGVSSMAYPRGANRGRGFGAPGKLKNGAPRRRCWMGEGGSMLEVFISFSDNVIGIRLLKFALTLNWLVLNGYVRAWSTRKFEMLSKNEEHITSYYSVNFMNNFGLLVWVPINRYYWVILGIIVKILKKIFKINVKRVYCCILKW